MSTSFSENIIGSWLFIRSTEAFKPRIIHHFTADGKCVWEMEAGGRRDLSLVKYRCEGNKLTVIFSDGKKRDYELIVEDDSSVRIPGREGHFWWMIRLAAPESYSIAFVDQHGQLEKLLGA